MSNSHIIQYIAIVLITLLVIFYIIKKIIKIQKCNNPKEICRYCPSKSICGKVKKSNKDIAQSKK